MNKLLFFKALTAGLLVLSTSGIRADDATDAAAAVFEPPVRLTADGKIIDTGEDWGHSSPCVADLDGDGLDDLIVGDFGGKFHVYRNIGSAEQPKYKADGLLQAGGVDAEVEIYCCIGGQARMGDLDGDGNLDMISNSYDPGHCYLFRGLPDQKFAARVELLDRAGVPVRSSPMQQRDVESFGSFYELVDWENDGDLDILIGCFGGELKLRINEGTAMKPEFATENVDVKTRDGALHVEGHLCPVVADWDTDGMWDIIAGSEDGSVTFFRNVGEATSPAFALGQVLVPPHDGNGYNMVIWKESEIVPGIRSQIDVTDFNGDGRPDLILGDFYTSFDFKMNLSVQEKDDIEKRLTYLDSLVKAYVDKKDVLLESFTKRFPGDETYSDEADQAWQKEYKTLAEDSETKQLETTQKELVPELRPYLASALADGDELFDLEMPHGHVWVYLRKPRVAPEPVTVKFESSKQTVHAGDSIDITVNFKMAPGYEIHGFEKQPLATATRLKLDLPPGFTAGRQWEEPPITGLGSFSGGYGYQGSVTFYNEIRVADNVEPGDYQPTCSVAYQACDSKQCLRPVESKLKIKVSVIP